MLLNNLAVEKLDETAKDLATRWRWATAVPEVDWTELARYGRIQPEPRNTHGRGDGRAGASALSRGRTL